MTDRSYWPADYCDEWMPEGRASPDAWLERNAAGDFQIAKPADFDGFGPLPLAPGATMIFAWHIDYGAIPVLIRADGSFALEGEPHPLAQQFSAAPAVDTMADSVADFAAGIAEKYLRPQNLAEERVMMDMGAWADALYRLVVADATARFELVTAHPEGNA